MEPRVCRACDEEFTLGHLRLGYMPCEAVGGRCLPVWIHVRCARRARLVWRLAENTVGFGPAVSVARRQEVFEELRQLPTGPASTPQGSASRTSVRPWRYLPAQLQQWAVLPIPEATPRVGPLGTLPVFPPRAAGAPQLIFATLPDNLAARHSRRIERGELTSPGIQEVLAQLLAEAARSLPDGVLFPHSSRIDALLEQVPVYELERRSREPCVICLQAMLPAASCRRLPCLHTFHQECIDKWLHVKETCPLCKLTLSDMLEAQSNLSHRRSRSPRRR